MPDASFFRVALLVKNIEEGVTTKEDIKTLQRLVTFTDFNWQMLVEASAFTRTHLDLCIQAEEYPS